MRTVLCLALLISCIYANPIPQPKNQTPNIIVGSSSITHKDGETVVNLEQRSEVVPRPVEPIVIKQEPVSQNVPVPAVQQVEEIKPQPSTGGQVVPAEPSNIVSEPIQVDKISETSVDSVSPQISIASPEIVKSQQSSLVSELVPKVEEVKSIPVQPVAVSGVAKPIEQPKEVEVQQPKEVPVEQPKVVSAEQPREVSVEQPKIASVEQPKEVPVEQPKEVPVEQPKIAPVEQPKIAPVEQPKEVPVEQPKIAPVEQPKETPVEQPREAPVEQPKEAPVEQPKEAPVEQPKEVPVESIQQPVIESVKIPVVAENVVPQMIQENKVESRSLKDSDVPVIAPAAPISSVAPVAPLSSVVEVQPEKNIENVVVAESVPIISEKTEVVQRDTSIISEPEPIVVREPIPPVNVPVSQPENIIRATVSESTIAVVPVQPVVVAIPVKEVLSTDIVSPEQPNIENQVPVEPIKSD